LVAFFAVFFAAICDPPDWPPRSRNESALDHPVASPETTDVARRILPRMVMVKEILARVEPMYPLG
jgi:hypothetical protein